MENGCWWNNMDYVIYKGHKCGRGAIKYDTVEIYSETPIDGFEFLYGDYIKNVHLKDCDKIYTELAVFQYKSWLALYTELGNGKLEILVQGSNDLLEEGFLADLGDRGNYYKIIDAKEGKYALLVKEYTTKADGSIKAYSDTVYVYNEDGTQSIWSQKFF